MLNFITNTKNSFLSVGNQQLWLFIDTSCGFCLKYYHVNGAQAITDVDKSIPKYLIFTETIFALQIVLLQQS